MVRQRRKHEGLRMPHWRWSSLLGLVLVLSGLAGKDGSAANHEPLLLSRERVGAVHRGASEVELRRIFGAERIHDHLVQVGEGFVCQGTKIDFPGGDSLELTWLDANSRTSLDRVMVLGERWSTPEGLRLGSRLQDLEGLNDRSFMLSGFGWDYGGTVGTWNGGTLENLGGDGPPWVIVRLSPDRAAYYRIGRRDAAAVTGESAYTSSAHRAMQALSPRVAQIIVDFRAADCAAYFPE